MKKNSTKSSKNFKQSKLFIPDGVCIGIGVGLLVNKLVGGLFIGLGLGFLVMAIDVKR